MRHLVRLRVSRSADTGRNRPFRMGPKISEYFALLEIVEKKKKKPSYKVITTIWKHEYPKQIMITISPNLLFKHYSSRITDPNY